MNNYSLKIIKKIIPIILIILVIIGFIWYKSSSNHDKDELNIICNSIITENEKFTYALNDKIIDSSKAIDVLTDNQANLINIQSKLKSLKVKEENEHLKETLSKGISYNLKFDEQVISVLKNQSSDDLSDSLNNINALYSSCQSYFTKASNQGLKITIPDGFNKFFNNCCAYINELIKFKRDNDIEADQISDFKDNLTLLINNFKPLTENLHDAIDMVKKENRDLNVILNDLDKKYETYNELINESCQISYPEEYVQYEDLISKLFSDCDEYLSSLQGTISSDIKKESVNYDLSYEKYDDMISTYNNLKSLADRI